MAQNIIIAGATYQNVPAIEVPKVTSGTARYVDETETKRVWKGVTPSLSQMAEGDFWIITG